MFIRLLGMDSVISIAITSLYILMNNAVQVLVFTNLTQEGNVTTNNIQKYHMSLAIMYENIISIL